jgi:hypothetical protein
MDARTFETRNHPSRQVTAGRFDRCGARLSADGRQRPSRGQPIADSGASPIMRARLDAGCLTTICSTVASSLEKVKPNQDHEVVYLISDPISAMGKGVGRQAGRANSDQVGEVRTQAKQVGSARKGAVTDAGGRAEIVCHAEI